MNSVSPVSQIYLDTAVIIVLSVVSVCVAITVGCLIYFFIKHRNNSNKDKEVGERNYDHLEETNKEDDLEVSKSPAVLSREATLSNDSK